MTINIADNAPRANYTATSGQTVFTVSFEFFDEADLTVYINGSVTSDYTVSGGDGSTGTVTLTSGATAGDKIVIVRDVAIERTTDFTDGAAISRSALNEQLDKLTAQIADIDDRASRSLQLNDHEVAAGITLPSTDDRKGRVLGFNATTGDVEQGPEIADVQSLADVSADIATLADIEDGTENTDAIQTAAGIAPNISTVSGISSDVTTVAGISSDVTAVAADATDIGTVATNISSVNTVATNIADVITVANDLNEAVSEVVTVADDLNEAVSEIDTVAGSISNVDTVGTNIGNVNTVAGISANVSTVAGISADTTTVAGISGNVTTVAGISSDITTVAADAVDIGTVSGISANVSTVAGISSSVSTLALISANVTTVAGISANVTTVAGDSTNIGTVATDLSGSNTIGTVAGSISNVNTVSGSISNVNTVATNIASVNDFADKYRIGATDPTTDLDEGDLFYNTTTDTLKVYTGSAWEQGVTAGSGFLPTTGGGLTGNLTFGDNDKAIFGAGSDLQIFHDNDGSSEGSIGSYIKEGGTGDLRIRASNLQLQTALGERYLTGAENSATTIFYDNAAKLATTSTGIDVTGTVTADGLTVNGGYLTVDNGYGISTVGGLKYIADSDNNAPSTGLIHQFLTDSSSLALGIQKNGNVGIGTSSPDRGKLQLNHYNSISGGAFNSPHLALSFNTAPSDNDGYAGITYATSDSDNYGWSVGARRTNSGVGDFVFTQHTNSATGSERMRIDSSGNLLVGQTTASSTDVGVSARSNGVLIATADGSNSALFNRKTSDGDIAVFRKDGTSVGSIGTEGGDLTVGKAGSGLQFRSADPCVRPHNMTTNSPSDAAVDLGRSNTRFKDLYLSGGLRGNTTFKNNAGTTEYARFDSSGNLLVGRTDTGVSVTTKGLELNNSGYISASRTLSAGSGSVLYANRLTSDGDIVQFRKDGTTVGSIGTFNAAHIYFAGSNTGLKPENNIIYATNSAGSATDNTTDIGASSYRFKDLYLSGGVYLGGTGSANHLDDYEEGTWTPSFDGLTNTPTYHNNYGKYTKIGRVVTVQFFMQTNLAPTFSSNTAELKITGLPFTVDASGYTGSQGVALTQGLNWNLSYNTQNTTGQIASGVNTSEQMQFFVSGSGAIRGIVNNSAAAAGFIIEATVTYFVTD